LNEKINCQLREIDIIRTDFENAKSQNSIETNKKAEEIENLKAELENLCSQIALKDEAIATLKNDVQKQKEMHGT
jgi:predicted RNase H-like nuclease (RuvC/YqgF family)